MKKLLLLTGFLSALVLYATQSLNLHPVMPGVYRSAQPDADELRRLAARLNLSSSINLRGDNTGKDWYDTEIATARELNLKHFDVSLSAGRLPPWSALQKLVDDLDNAPLPLLIHCEYGADRSGFTSALLLLLSGKVSLDTASEQFSWRYRVFRKDTIGRQFLQQYQTWLEQQSHRHSPALLRQWIQQDYVDGDGNLTFYIDQINDTVWKNSRMFSDGYRFQLDGRKPVQISGWAVDTRNHALVRQVDILLNGKPAGLADYGINREDVAHHLAEPRYRNSGWQAKLSLDDWPRACYPLRLAITRTDNSRWTSPPLANICLN